MTLEQPSDAVSPWPRACAGTEGCPGNPLHCASSECVVFLLRLVFDRVEAAAMLTAVTGDSAACDLRVGVLYRKLAQAVRHNTNAACSITAALTERLGSELPCVDSADMGQIASTWARCKESMDGLSAAALLLAVARSPAPWLRKLEAVMVEDLQYLAARALTQHALMAGGSERVAGTTGDFV